MIRFRVYVVSVLVLLLVACQTTPVPQVEEGSGSLPLISTTTNDFGRRLALSGANLYVVGYTSGSLDGPNLGGYDAFLRRYNGVRLWGEQFGSQNDDFAIDVVTDSSGNIYVLGQTSGAIGFRVGGSDNFLVKYNPSGSLLWGRQFGSKGNDSPKDLAIDSNNRLYVLSDEGSNSFTLRRFNTAGTLQASKTFSFATRPVLTPVALAVDSLNNPIVLTYWNNYAAGKSNDIRLYKYDSNFNQTWVKAYSSPETDTPYDITTDSNNNIYFSFRRSAANRGAYFQKRDASGTTVYTRRLEHSATSSNTFPHTITTDSANQVYIAGYTLGAFAGFTNAGYGDIVVFKYTASGTERWVTQFGQGNYGSADNDYAYDIVVGSSIYITGRTDGNLVTGSATSYGGPDAYIANMNKATGEILGVDQ